ncbi:RNA exonuclease 1 homolog [Spea bombifrons]|uniref:RNA exonuclease 1 homolog n=1 Tax=Spea bombifrons TaxID=233779 RepID=UPI00234BEE48|nr:RNA exonuclease 1 homolog [Spea bombifrons]
MLRPAGYFQQLPCPFWLRPGGCQRPHCQFRHVPPEGGSEGASEKNSAAAGGDKEALGKSIQELERLNKAIEAVKNEVEEKQKKLLLYRNVTHSPTKHQAPKVDSNCNILAIEEEHTPIIRKTSVTTAITSNKNINSPRSKKYVIDRRCPATDLEYDPLLNYSAGLLGSTKEGETPKSKRSNSGEEIEHLPQKKPRDVSPIRLEIKLQESDDDDVLIIDAPPLQQVVKKHRPNRFHASEEKAAPSPDDVMESVDNAASEHISMEKTEHVSPVEKAESVSSALEPTSVADLSREGLVSAVDQIIDLKNDDLIVSDVITTIEEAFVPEQSEVKNYSPLNCNQSILAETLLEDTITVPKYEVKYSPREDSLTQSQCFLDGLQDLESDITVPADVSALEENVLVTQLENGIGDQEHKPIVEPLEKVNDVIVLDSSSEAEDTDSDTDLSDSEDPMEECLRIFNEFTERELNKDTKQSSQDQSEMDIPDAKASDAPVQKKRVAHPSAKCDVKSSGSILVPYRGPAPQQIPQGRILHVQQKAVQITAAVKSGQAFVASTQKKITGCVSPAFHNFGQMVYLNLVEVQPVAQGRNQISGFFQGGTIATTLKSCVPPKRTMQTPPMKISSRKKSSVVQETACKVPQETRQRYVNSFVEEFLKDSATVQEAFDKALNEEKSIYDRCGSKNMYLNIAVNSLKKLRDQRNVPNGSQPSSSKENASGSRKQDDRSDITRINLYNYLKDYLLSDEQLKENGYPRPNLEKPGSALLHNGVTKTIGSDALRRVCCRCGEIYSVTSQGKHVRKEECTYHSGKVLRHRVPGGMETRYSCCEAAVGSPGCQMAKLHVHDGLKDNLDGFIKTFVKLQPSDGNPGVFSLDCEMCYTTHGLELTRVTVVDPSLQVVYDTFVKPDNDVIDYNTRFSGVTEDNLANVTTSIRDVQAVMLNLFSADTILIGHSLENDLLALKLLHDTVVDTSIVFPHRLGLPHKKALRNLMADYLRRIIQDNVGGHDSSEDAAACMELMLWKVKEDTKGRR